MTVPILGAPDLCRLQVLGGHPSPGGRHLCRSVGAAWKGLPAKRFTGSGHGVDVRYRGEGRICGLSAGIPETPLYGRIRLFVAGTSFSSGTI